MRVSLYIAVTLSLQAAIDKQTISALQLLSQRHHPLSLSATLHCADVLSDK
jgi:hypothetical protein